ncbi:MAG: hypothetical protein K2Q22_13575 [Cytophagales bacterium]|nr:hypothetical protein [Cytophagales bacterium]
MKKLNKLLLAIIFISACCFASCNREGACDGYIIPVYAKTHYQNGYGAYLNYLDYYFKDSTRLVHSSGRLSTIKLADTIVGTQSHKSHTSGDCYDTYIYSTLKANFLKSDSLLLPISMDLNNSFSINYRDLTLSYNQNYNNRTLTVQGIQYSQVEQYYYSRKEDTIRIYYDKQFGIVKIINSPTDFYERLP